MGGDHTVQVYLAGDERFTARARKILRTPGKHGLDDAAMPLSVTGRCVGDLVAIGKGIVNDKDGVGFVVYDGSITGPSVPLVYGGEYYFCSNLD